MVHVIDLLGCVAVGPTTEAAIENMPEAISAFRRFLHRIGEDVDPEGSFATHVEEHITEGDWLGNGSPYVTFKPDHEPVSEAELTLLTNRVACLREELAAWAEAADPATLEVMVPGSSRTTATILLHVLGPTGAYLSPVLGTISGVTTLRTQAERGQLPIADALRQSAAIVTERLRGATEAQRNAVIQRPKELRTLRKGLRRTLEHDWEHLAELSRRPGGLQI
jgi:predicted RNase H-like HicB family nuclease